jgi:hypothetical protein
MQKSAIEEIKELKAQLESKTEQAKAEALDKASEAVGCVASALQQVHGKSEISAKGCLKAPLSGALSPREEVAKAVGSDVRASHGPHQLRNRSRRRSTELEGTAAAGAVDRGPTAMVSENVPRVAISAGRSNFSTISTARSSGTFSNVFDQAIIRSPASSIEMLFSDYLREKSCVTQNIRKQLGSWVKRSSA